MSLDGPTNQRPRLLLADDNKAIRYLFRKLVSAECDVIGEAETGQAAIQAVQELEPDVLVLDISMPGMNGFEVVRTVRERTPEVHIILASQYSDRIYAEEAFKLGAKAYVLKSAAVNELLTAVRGVLAGGVFCSADVSA